ncbi:MAG: c-type cytochrome [Bacteroidetes bacterium]|nr:c-type cytochrome [Bacteroidota bacterium]
MNSTRWRLLAVSLSFMGWLASCSILGGEASPEPLFSVPATFPQPTYDLSKNPITNDGVALGKQLFFDSILSRDGSISCGECHNQSHAFTHHGHGFSHGIDNQEGTRNAPPLINLAWQDSFFWDGGVFDLDLFSIAPIENPLEMDEKIGNVLQKLRASKEYPKLFKKAYGSEEITTERFLKALSQFMLTLVSANSKYDQFLAGKAQLSTEESAGLQLFKDKGCAKCHSGALFTDHSFRSNGLLPEYTGDLGRYRITENEADKNKFKVPTLRNIEVTYPYMHDARFLNLEAVLRFYAEGVKETGSLDPLLKQNGRLGIPMTADEQQKIIAFLKTLTDQEFLTNPRFAAP